MKTDAIFNISKFWTYMKKKIATCLTTWYVRKLL